MRLAAYRAAIGTHCFFFRWKNKLAVIFLMRVWTFLSAFSSAKKKKKRERNLNRHDERARYRDSRRSFEFCWFRWARDIAPFKPFSGVNTPGYRATERATRSQPPFRTRAEGDRSAFTLRTYPCGKTQIRIPLEEQEQRRLKSPAFLAGANFRRDAVPRWLSEMIYTIVARIRLFNIFIKLDSSKSM